MFEWDDEKNAANTRKHGVGFERAAGIFEGKVLTIVDDRFKYGEKREISIGQIEDVLFLTVVHTDRIISARRASRAERKRYEKAIRQGVEHRGTGGDEG